VGQSMQADLKTELVLKGLDMAVKQRRPRGIILHSGQGRRYASGAFGPRCNMPGYAPPSAPSARPETMRSAKSFSATLVRAPNGRLRRHRGWYNPHRRHSGFGQKSSLNFERDHHHAA